MSTARAPIPRGVLLSRTVVGIVLATFFSDVGHEMATAVLPLFLLSVGLGPAALGVMEGVADLLFSLSKLTGGVVGHHVRRKRVWGGAGYLVTALGTGLMAFAGSVASLALLRAVAWIGRGFRSPIRDFLLSDAVPPTHFGRVYGVERTADMLGAVAGPMVAAILLWLHVDVRIVILVSFGPSLLSAISFFALTRDADPKSTESAETPVEGKTPARPSTMAGLRAIPRGFWVLLMGVFLFGLGDFSRTFLIVLAASNDKTAGGLLSGAGGGGMGAALGTSVALYTMHNLVSAAAAYPIGHLGDRYSKLKILAGGYALGVITNVLLATVSTSFAMLAFTIVLSGTYIAVEETLEKASCAAMLPRELRTLGLGVLAAANAFGDMLSSIFVGWQLEHGTRLVAFGVPAMVGAIGATWIAVVSFKTPTPGHA